MAQNILDDGEEGFIKHIRTLERYRKKAKNVMKMVQMLVDGYQGAILNSSAALKELPGMGRRTANVVLNIWWGHPAHAVDKNIFRENRSGIRPFKDFDAKERAIEDSIPEAFQCHAHHWLTRYRHYCFKARKPLCKICLMWGLYLFEEIGL